MTATATRLPALAPVVTVTVLQDPGVEHVDGLTCRCGNAAHVDGFDLCEFSVEHARCVACGLVFDLRTWRRDWQDPERFTVDAHPTSGPVPLVTCPSAECEHPDRVHDREQYAECVALEAAMAEGYPEPGLAYDERALHSDRVPGAWLC